MRISFIIPFLALAVSCTNNSVEPVRLAGETQGTTYSIIYINPVNPPKPEKIHAEIEALLIKFDYSLSSYNHHSLISSINEGTTDSVDIWFTEVYNASLKVWSKSGGAFDITAAPLIKAWGFGPDAMISFKEEIKDSLLTYVGMDKTSLNNGRIIRTIKGITFDVNGIAQGYSVDVVSDFLRSKGITSFLVEIGGEVRTSGTKNGAIWKVGVDKPVDGNYSPGADIQAVIELADRSLATSGNYRKFYIGADGLKYSHTIDPRTGYPVRNKILSATVIASDCASADAWATACMVADIDGAIEFIESNPDLEGYFIYSGDEGQYMEWMSKGMEKLLSHL